MVTIISSEEKIAVLGFLGHWAYRDLINNIEAPSGELALRRNFLEVNPLKTCFNSSQSEEISEYAKQLMKK